MKLIIRYSLSLLLVLVVVTLSACFGRLFRASIVPILPESKLVATQQTNQPRKVYKGEKLLTLKRGAYYDAYKSKHVFLFRRWRLEPGEVWLAKFKYKGACDEGEYIISGGSFEKQGLGLIVSKDGRVLCSNPVINIAVGKGSAKSYYVSELQEPDLFQPIEATPVNTSQEVQYTFAGVRNGKVVIRKTTKLNENTIEEIMLNADGISELEGYKIRIEKIEEERLQYTILDSN
jgi:hypothetical protein